MSLAAGGNGGTGGTVPLTLEAILAEVDKRSATSLAAALDTFKKGDLTKVLDERLTPVSTALSSINEAGQALSTAHASAGGGTGGGTGGGAGAGTGSSAIPPELNAQMKELKALVQNQGNTITTLQTAKADADKRAETAERHGVIRQALSGLSFTNDAAAKTAFVLTEAYIKRLDDGMLVGSSGVDNLPVDTFVNEFIAKEHGYLLRPVGGSGSGGGVSQGQPLRQGMRSSIEDIKPGMTPATREQVVASIAAAVQQAQGQ